AHVPEQADLVAVSGANQYRVRPFALASTVTLLMRTVLSALPAAVAAEGPAAATEAPRAASAATDTAATDALTTRPVPGAPARRRAGGPLPARPRLAGMATRPASAANAATSITPAAIPAVVRTSVKPNRPVHNDSR